MTSYQSKNRKATTVKFCIRHAFMVIMTHANSHFKRLMITLIFGIWTCELTPPRPGEQLKRPGLMGLSWIISNPKISHF